ncbi:MAG: S-layer homology domain-containing protein [Acidobacteria bacterium]|nr:S-layer homology domain-containing protein [Acidobacteriota bacterium]
MYQPKSRRWSRREGLLWLSLLVLAMAAVSSRASAGETVKGEVKTFAFPKAVPYVITDDLRNLPQVAAPRRLFTWEHEDPPIVQPPGPAEADVVPNTALAPMPSPLRSFDGLSSNTAVTGGQAGGIMPSDVNGDVGPNHYIEAVNDAYAIYNKSGTLLTAFTENSLWSGTGSSPCNGNSKGDAVVLHDGLADRWILTHLAFATSGSAKLSPFYQCIAVSRTSDPVTGGWYGYAIRMDTGGTGQPPVGTLNDYPKFGLWTDCLYMTANGYTEQTTENFIGTMFASFSRSDMYSGAVLTGALGFLASTNSDPFTMIPSTLLGTSAGSLPPSGTPNYFVSQSWTQLVFEVRKFTAGANCGSGGTLSLPTNVSQPSYAVAAGSFVPQPNTTNQLDSQGHKLMQRVQYRKIGNSESVWVVHTVRSSSTSPVEPHWAQINVTGGTISPTPVQQQIYVPDASLNRWMPSLAVDGQGNMALGYSTSNSTRFPSIAYSGRLAGDALNNLPQTETQLIAGSGSQTNNCGNPSALCNRWGDYTAMSIDPVDDCTFWYINQYYSSQTNGTAGNWQTRIGSFKFPGCGQTPPPSVTTTPASGISQSAATLNGTVNPNGASTNAYFEWGTTTGYGNTTFSQNVGSGTTAVAYSVNLGSLSCNTTYHFRGAATNSGGPGFGGDRSFTTSPCPVTAPSVTTDPATGIGQTGATLNASVNPNGSSTTAAFEWGLTSSYGNNSDYGPIGSGTGVVPIGTALVNLSCNTIYHFRVRAANTGGTSFGGDRAFTTNSCPQASPPIANVSAATNVGQTSATLNASVNPNGSATNAYFEYGTAAAGFTNSTTAQSLGSGTSFQTVSQSLGNLACNRAYVFRAVASNVGGTVHSANQGFTTQPCAGQGLLFRDTLENGIPNWLTQAPWALTTNSAHSLTHSWTTSPDGPYGPNLNSSIFTPTIDLSGVTAAGLSFWHHYDLESGFDRGNVWVTPDDGVSFTLQTGFTGTKSGWTLEGVDLSSFAGQRLRIVFQLLTDSSISGNGWYLDDFVVRTPTFGDVLPADFAWSWIEALYANGITNGCSVTPRLYCPNDSVTRAQMAVFLMRGMLGSSHQPPPAQGTVFLDVASGDFAADWIEEFAAQGITHGCGNGRYCPGDPVTRAQMAIFLLRAKHGSTYQPPPATGFMFNDVNTGDFAADWIEQLAREEITLGCGGGSFCPGDAVSRAQMAIFLMRTFNLLSL